MVIDLKLCRFENASWGFRLTGGSDFDIPLTVVKVTEGSIAEQAGMRVGDIIVRINDDTTSVMTHNDAHQVITHCGNSFFLGILRQSDNEEDLATENTHENLLTPDSAIRSPSKSPISNASSEKKISLASENNEPIPNDNRTEEEKVTDDEIAEMMSGEAEVLKEHNVIGVNFNRIFPKAGICQSSEVLRTLNEEAVKTKIEREKDKRKWTTFLQKPDRPIPKSKQELEEEAKRLPYKVKIVKQPKPKVAPDRIPTPPPSPSAEPEPEIKPEEQLNEVEKNEPVEELEELPTDSEVPNLEPIEDDVCCNEENQSNQEQVETQDENNNNSYEDMDEQKIEEVPQKTEEELILERQLIDVQKQLLALSTLPSTIQATLDSVTKQLSELLPNFRLQPSPNPETIPQDNNPVEDAVEEAKEEVENGGENDCEECEPAENDTAVPADDIQEEQYQEVEPSAEEIEKQKLQAEQQQMEEELNYKKQKRQNIRSVRFDV